MSLQIIDNTVVDLLAHQRVVKQCSTHTYGRGAGDDKFQCILRIDDTALADDGDSVGFTRLINLVGFQQGDGLDGGAGEATLIVADDGHTLFDIDGHAHEGIDDRKAVGASLDTAARVFLYVGLVGGEFGDQRFVGYLAASLHYARGHLRVIAEGDAAFLHIRAGDVDLHSVDVGVIKQARDFGVLFHRGAGDISDKARFLEIQGGEDVIHHVTGAGVLQADSVEHASGGFHHPVRRVAEARFQRGALEADGAHIPIGKAFDPRVFFAEANATR